MSLISLGTEPLYFVQMWSWPSCSLTFFHIQHLHILGHHVYMHRRVSSAIPRHWRKRFANTKISEGPHLHYRTSNFWRCNSLQDHSNPLNIAKIIKEPPKRQKTDTELLNIYDGLQLPWQVCSAWKLAVTWICWSTESSCYATMSSKQSLCGFLFQEIARLVSSWLASTQTTEV